MSTIGDNRLAALAADIQTTHREIQADAEKMAERAIAAGHMLIEAKALISHGQWASWLQGHCGFSDRTARRYMQLARSGLKTAMVAIMGIAGASSAIAKKTSALPSHRTFSPEEEAAYQAWAAEIHAIIDAVGAGARERFLAKPEVQLALTRQVLASGQIPAEHVIKFVDGFITFPEMWTLACILLMEDERLKAEASR